MKNPWRRGRIAEFCLAEFPSKTVGLITILNVPMEYIPSFGLLWLFMHVVVAVVLVQFNFSGGWSTKRFLPRIKRRLPHSSYLIFLGSKLFLFSLLIVLLLALIITNKRV